MTVKEKENAKESLIIQLVEFAINLGNTFIDSGNTERALAALAVKTLDAYEDYTGEPINLALIRSQASL